MKRDYPDRPLVGVGAVIVHDGRVVIVQRGTEPLKGQWSIPGGALEIGETLRQCAEREAQEETGLLVEATDVLEVFDAIHKEPGGRTRYHYVLIDFRCRLTDVPPCNAPPELRAGGDALQANWVTAEELAEYQVAETAKKVIGKALSLCT
jgi:ADP-ribose pyrophosphatase YjhB (NUDIX family)